jgi:hypothetical protein
MIKRIEVRYIRTIIFGSSQKYVDEIHLFCNIRTLISIRCVHAREFRHYNHFMHSFLNLFFNIIFIFLHAQKNESKKGHPMLLPFRFSPGSPVKRDLRNSLSLKQVANLHELRSSSSQSSEHSVGREQRNLLSFALQLLLHPFFRSILPIKAKGHSCYPSPHCGSQVRRVSDRIAGKLLCLRPDGTSELRRGGERGIFLPILPSPLDSRLFHLFVIKYASRQSSNIVYLSTYF